MFAKVRKFVEEDIWRIRAKGLPPLRAAGLRSLRILLAAAREIGRAHV